MTNEEFIDKLIEHIKSMSDEDRSVLCEELIIQCMNWGGHTIYESIGIAEEAKRDYIQRWEDCMRDDDDDDYEDGDEWKRLLKK